MVRALRNQNGLTLLESLAGIALLGVVCFGFISWVHFFGQGVSNANQNEAVANAMIHLATAFGGDDRYCTSILGGISLGADPVGSQVSSIDYFNIDGAKQANVMAINQSTEKNSSLMVADIRLKPTSNLNPTTIYANLEVTFRKSQSFLGGQEIIRKIPIYATVQGGKVVTCSTSPTTTMIINNRICQVKNDGYAHYDVASSKCVDNDNVKWFTGTDPFSATCPAGYKPAVSSMDPDPQLLACAADANESTTPLAARSYSNGAVDNTALKVWTAKMTGSPVTTCVFAYEVGVSTVNAKGKIKCAKN